MSGWAIAWLSTGMVGAVMFWGVGRDSWRALWGLEITLFACLLMLCLMFGPFAILMALLSWFMERRSSRIARARIEQDRLRREQEQDDLWMASYGAMGWPRKDRK